MIAYKHDNIVGRFSCKGFDTFGPFKLIGGVSKGHPDDKDLAEAVEFYNGLTEQPVFLNRETGCFYNSVLFIILFFIAQDSDKSHHVHLAQYKDNVAWFYRIKTTSLL